MQMRIAARYLTLLISLTLGYAALGWLSLKLAVPPGYASPAFPAAGVALSAVLIFGLRIWPAVFAGSLIVHVLASLTIGTAQLSPVLVCMLASASTIQAIAGAWLAQRLIGFPNRLDAPGPIVRFIVVVAPLSALVAASIATPILSSLGVLSANNWTFNWWNWWLGDSLGIIAAAPLMFVFFGQPAKDWRGRRIGVAVPLALALTILIFAFHRVIAWEEMRVEGQFKRDTGHIASLISKRLDAQLDTVLAIKGLMVASEEVTRAEFHSFVAPWLKRYPGTQNFTWNPLIHHANRDEFERALRATGQPDFHIVDRSLDGRVYPARASAEYLPITYIEPLEANLSALGVNPLSLAPAVEAIDETRLSRLPVAAAPFRLVQETDSQSGVVVYLAVESSDPQAQFPEAGIISTAFRMDEALAAARSDATAAGIELCLVDLKADPARARLSGPAGCELDDWLAEGITQRIDLPFASRPWQLRLRATAAYIQSQRSWAAWTTVATGLFGVGLLGAFLLITTGNTRRIAALVERRTRELQTTTASLREKQQALAQAMRIARMGSWETRDGRRGLHCSRELHQLLDCDERRLTSLGDILASIRAEDRPLLQSRLDQLSLAPGQASLDCHTDTTPAHIVHFQIESEWHEGTLLRLRGTVQDVTEAREADAHIQFLAHFDTLTGLPNRTAWIKHAREALAAAERHGDRMAVLFLDLDNFKTINDSLGHPVGDRLLASVARRLSACLRGSDRLARLGGDEFVALLPRLDHAEDGAVAAQKMLEVLGEPVRIDEHELRPSVSIGIATYPEDGNTIDILLKHADTAMYGAKAAGRNNFQFFVAEMNQRANERLQLESALRRAGADKQLSLHYQAQIDTVSGRVVGCEALLRWRHPQRGMVPPDTFIPVAEDSGMIVPIGDWVLREACRQQAEWRNQGLGGLTLAINISAIQFQRESFPETVQSILAETGADPTAIELEITESALMQPGPVLSARLQKLVDLGLTLALDDFGTGYSCLAYLKRLPLSRIKIDRSFVTDLPGNTEDAAVVSAALSLAHDLGMEVVAEGVETAAQRAFLTERKCTLMQGYLFSRPLDAASFTSWVRGANKS